MLPKTRRGACIADRVALDRRDCGLLSRVLVDGAKDHCGEGLVERYAVVGWGGGVGLGTLSRYGNSADSFESWLFAVGSENDKRGTMGGGTCRGRTVLRVERVLEGLFGRLVTGSMVGCTFWCICHAGRVVGVAAATAGVRSCDDDAGIGTVSRKLGGAIEARCSVRRFQSSHEFGSDA